MRNRQIIVDPGHPKKQCLYCLAMFVCDHELRKFCEFKFGIPNYCKRKFKEIVEQVRLTGKGIILSSKDSLTSTVVEYSPTNGIIVNQANANSAESITPNETVQINNVSNPEAENLKKENEVLKERFAQEKQIEKNKEVIRKFINKKIVEGSELALEGAKFNNWNLLAKLHGFYFKRTLFQSYYEIVHPYPVKFDTYVFK